MPKFPISSQQECNHTPLYRSALSVPVLFQSGYQQALTDFAITELLHSLNTFFDTHFDATRGTLTSTETETLAAILIQTLTRNLNGNLLATYLKAIRHPPLETLSPLTKLRLPPPATDLPVAFPDVETPRFLYGDRLRWITDGETTDWGAVIGTFYSFASHCCCWRWCYLIWLDPNSPSAAWVRADIAWEDDLEPFETEPDK
ncbi:MAG: hypothetical protein QNJ46_15315 [Leptolyngbyaceae cyanobacterium MO_188.B28]|nr:hypothetical protein [Leptolyngbyaceae cyanobacterium MO_188.B28]